MFIEPSKEMKRIVVSHDMFIKKHALDIYRMMGRKSKLIGALRKSNYALYWLLSKLKIWKLKRKI